MECMVIAVASSSVTVTTMNPKCVQVMRYTALDLEDA